MHKVKGVGAVGRVVRSLPKNGVPQRAASTRYGYEEDYLEEAVYPPVYPKEQITKEMKEKLAWHEKISKLPTYEQKICELNMPKGYGYYSVQLDDQEFKLGGLPFLKFVTRTEIEESLPQDYYKEVSVSARVASERLAPQVEQLVRLHFHHGCNRAADDDSGSKTDFLNGLHRLLTTTLPAPRHAKSVSTPRLHAWWLAGGVHHTGIDRWEWEHLKLEDREKKQWVENLWRDREDPHMGDHPIASVSHPLLSLRERAPLPPVMDRPATPTDTRALLAHAFPTPPCHNRLPPESYDYESDFVHARLLPGYWPGESHRHARVHYHEPHFMAFTGRYGHSHTQPRKHITVAPDLEDDVPETEIVDKDKPETRTTEDEAASPVEAVVEQEFSHKLTDPLHHQLIISAHTQALSQAAVAGFGPVTELTYPIVQHNVVSDGHSFVLSLHQCNTIALHSGNTSEMNPHHNKLWVSPEMKLWDHIVPETGEVVGLNKELLTQLAAMYQKETVPLKDETPHLAPYKYLWNHPAGERYRGWFLEKVRLMTSGRLWYQKRPELTAWERIYKLDYNTMPEENNGKKFYDPGFFQMLPWNRTMKHDTSKLIRRDDRPLGRKDPVKRLPIIDSEKLFDKHAREYRNWRLF